jgi:hypothetical protein
MAQTAADGYPHDRTGARPRSSRAAVMAHIARFSRSGPTARAAATAFPRQRLSCSLGGSKKIPMEQKNE